MSHACRFAMIARQCDRTRSFQSSGTFSNSDALASLGNLMILAAHSLGLMLFPLCTGFRSSDPRRAPTALLSKVPELSSAHGTSPRVHRRRVSTVTSGRTRFALSVAAGDVPPGSRPARLAAAVCTDRRCVQRVADPETLRDDDLHRGRADLRFLRSVRVPTR